jgi:hypothetical protein
MNARKIFFVVTALIAASAWLAYAERPTPRSLRRAIRDTLPLL